MAQKRGNNDGAYGRVMMRAGDLARRVGEGTVPEERALHGIQMLSEGASVQKVASDPRLLSVEGLKRLMLEPDRPLDSWREVLGIEKRDWIDDIGLFAEPEQCEVGLSEIWYYIEKPGCVIWSLEASNRLLDRDLRGFTMRMNFALAKAERDMIMASGSLVALSSARHGSKDRLFVPCLGAFGVRLSASVYWYGGGVWSEGCEFPGFRKL